MPGLEQLTVGPLDVNCYIVWDDRSRSAAIIDPGAEPERILRRAGELGVEVQIIINTHGHVDHIGANAPVKEALGCPIAIHKDDVWLLNDELGVPIARLIGAVVSPAPDRMLIDGDRITLGETVIEVIHTPGHSPGSVCLLCDNLVFTGDTLFVGGVGRTDLPGGSYEELVKSIRTRLFALADETIVLPGHDYGARPRSTIGQEKSSNPFLRG